VPVRFSCSRFTEEAEVAGFPRASNSVSDVMFAIPFFKSGGKRNGDEQNDVQELRQGN
jgi:hypothetical protein